MAASAPSTSPAVAVAAEPRDCPFARALSRGRNDAHVADNDRGDDVAAPDTPSCVAAGDHDAPLFTPLERLVIDIGYRDPLTRIAYGSRLARLRRWLFGIEAPRPFGDRRLEALRGLVLALRRHGHGAEAEIAAALQAGISRQQVEHLRSAG